MTVPHWIILTFLAAASACAQDAPRIAHAPVTEHQPQKERTILDTLGINQFGRFVSQSFGAGRMKQAAGNAASTVFSPVGRAVKNSANAISDRFGGTSSESSQSKKEESRQNALKIQAMQYLVTLDSSSHSNIIETVAAYLDDPSESIRMEALKGIQARLKKAAHDPFATQRQSEQWTANNYQSVGGPVVNAPSKPNMSCVCESCRCHRKVIDRVTSQLLATDESGRLKERSLKVRDFGSLLIEESLDQLNPARAPKIEKEMAEPAAIKSHETLKPRELGDSLKDEIVDPDLPRPRFIVHPPDKNQFPRR